MSITYSQLRRGDDSAGDESPAAEATAQTAPAGDAGSKRKGSKTSRKSRAAPKPSRATGDLEKLRARVQTLADDAHSTTALLEAAKVEIDSLRKALAAAPARHASESPSAPAPATISAERVDARAEVDQLRRALDAALGELASERDLHHKRGLELVETVRRSAGDLHTATHALNCMKAERDDRLQAEAAREAAAQAHEKALNERLRELNRMAVHPGWFLRLDDGRILGPATEAELVTWAAQCRIGPTHALSRDKQAWTPALNVPSLGLEWMVTLTDGTPFGPLNIQAVPHLIADGSVAVDAPIKSIRTGYTCSARDAGVPEMLGLREELDRLKQELAGVQAARDAAVARAAPEPPPKSVREQILKRAGRN